MLTYHDRLSLRGDVVLWSGRRYYVFVPKLFFEVLLSMTRIGGELNRPWKNANRATSTESDDEGSFLFARGR